MTTISLSNDPYTPLAQRGLADIAQAMGWEPNQQNGRDGWRFPMYRTNGKPVDGVYRWKAAVRNGQGSDYLWLPKKPEHVFYYLHADIKADIESRDGVLYLAEGEPDTLTYWAAGFTNAMGLVNGGAAISEQFVEHLHYLGVKRLIYAPDTDEVGLKSAAKVANLLKDSDIELDLRQLPFDFTRSHGKDVNDLWKLVEFRADRFSFKLSACKPLTGYEIYLVAPKAARTEQQRLDYKNLYTDWVKLIKAALGAPAKTTNGIDWWHCPLPTHDDKHPSFRVSYDRNKEQGIPQCSCGIQDQRGPWEQVAKALSVQTWDDFKREHAPKSSTTTPKASSVKQREKPQDYFMSRTEAATLEQSLYKGDKAFKTQLPLLFPIPALHHLGGLCRVVPVGKMVLVIGISGGGKTTFLEAAIATRVLTYGSVIYDGIEFSQTEYIRRELVRLLHIPYDAFLLNDIWDSEVANGMPEHARRGVPFDAETKQAIIKTLDTIIAQKSQIFYLTQKAARLPVEKRLADGGVYDAILEESARIGQPARVLVVDYLQLMKKTGRSGDAVQMLNEIADMYKEYVISRGLIAFVATQPLKQVSRKVKGNGAEVQGEDAYGITMNVWNLVVTLTPHYSETEPDKVLPVSTLKVAKNTNGQTGNITIRRDLEGLGYLI